MNTPLKVLMIEDSESDAELIIRLLQRANFQPVCQQIQTDEELRNALSSGEWDIILADYSMPQFDALEALKTLQSFGLDIPFIVVSGAIGEDTAVAAMKAGAHDYLMKDNLARLVPAIHRELREAEMRRAKRKSQKALIESLAQYDFLFNNMDQGVIYYDTNGRIISANPAAEKILGLSKKQMMEKNNHDSKFPVIKEDGTEFIPDDHPYMKALNTGEKVRDVVMGVFNEQLNEYRWITVNAVPQFMPGSTKPYQVFATFDDITELKKIEQALRESEKLLNRAQQIAHVGHWRLNLETQVIVGSDEFYRIFGITQDKLAFETFISIIHPDHREASVQNLRKAMDTQTNFDTEYWIICPSGDHKYIRMIGEIAFDRKSNSRLMVGTVQDITERKRAEEERQKLEIQLRQAQKMEAVGQLAGGVAHDFNNMLYVISGYSELIIDDLPPDNPIRKKVEMIMKTTQRASTLVRQLLLFSRKEAMQLKYIDLNELIGNLIKMIRRMIGEHITLNIHPGFNIDNIYADPGQIEQVLMNLCVNARDAMPEGGVIEIETKNVSIDDDFCLAHPWARKGQYVLMRVSDTGCGIPKELHERIFEPFFTTKEVGKGTGLGLSAVYGIVKSHQGFIDLTSEVGKGTTFKIYLPSADKKKSQKNLEEIPLPKISGRNETILIAEDDDDVRSVIESILENASYRVISAKDGEEAISLFDTHANEIHLAILDVVMPKAGGQKVLERIKSVKPELPVIFLTGYSKGMLPISISHAPHCEVIQKPVTRPILLNKIKDALKN